MFAEAEVFAPVASAWAGYYLPPELAVVMAAKESGFRNLRRHVHGGAPGNLRSAGYFCMTAPAVARCATELVLSPFPSRSDYSAVADWTVHHPRYQVRMLFRWFAKVIRDVTHGDLMQALQIYRWGDLEHGHAYADSARKYWGRKFGVESWPSGGRLERLPRAAR